MSEAPRPDRQTSSEKREGWPSSWPTVLHRRLKTTVQACIDTKSSLQLKAGRHQTVLVDVTAAPRKLALVTHPFRAPVRLLAAFLYMLEAAMCCTYIRSWPFRQTGSTLKREKCCILLGLGQDVPNFPFLIPSPVSPRPFLSFFRRMI